MPVREERNIDMLRMVCDWLSDEENGPWLMILDNADDDELWLGSNARTPSSGSSLPLIDYLPRCDHGGILVTTRDSQLGYRLTESKQSPIQITRFEPDEARLLLMAKLADDKTLSRDNADELTSALEYLPLTITQAAAYLRQIDISASEYLNLFRKGEADIPNLLESSIDDPGRDRETSNSVFHTWKLSFDQISKQSPSAADMLSLMAVLDRQAIPEELLHGPDVSFLDFKAAVSRLKAFSLINVEKSSSKYSVHRLVQLSTQKWLEHHGTLSMWEEVALAAVARVFPSNVEYNVWQLIQDLIFHAQIVLRYNTTTRSCQVARANILHGMGHYCLEQGQDTSALDILSQSQELRVENLGPEHEDTLTTIGLLSVAYNKLDHFTKAYEMQTALLETAERALGPSHRLTLKCMSRLAITYHKKRELSRAEELQLRTLKAMERELGLEDKITMTEMNNIAFTYNKQGKWREAEEIGLRTLELRTQVLGPAHPDTLTIMASLAWTYREQGRWEETEQLERKALAQRLESLGPDHPKTLLTMANLARTHSRRGGWNEAEMLHEEVLDRYSRLLGANHQNTRHAEEELARLRLAMQRNEVNRTPNSRLLNPGWSETRSRARDSRPTDSYRPSYGRNQSAGSLSPCGPGGYDRRSRRRNASPYGEHGMDWQRSLDWRKK